ncbi:AP-3 complex subunit beta-1 isoform X5 [Platichthys flesus]|uniref:AP-3 complex subunit beta-1 isoform X5 n=1 Tax=Platichthys flesus TaxID=8260 RepID=UPI002DC038B7|nr:AP-3 complex subunit beta-1 isoform X5 [Platichthys flesus]
MTSGYGTYRPEEQEGGDDRDDHTITEFDQDSRGDVSEMRDEEEEDDRPSSFGFEMESTRERGDVQTRPESEDQNQPGADGAAWRSPGARPEEDVPDSEDKDGTNERPEGRGHVSGLEDGFTSDEKNPEEGTGSEKPDEEEREAEEEDPDDSSSNKDIKFIDSKVDFSWMAYDDMEWEGNLRQKKASGLEEGLAELHVSSSTQQDFETENEDVPSHSSEEDRISLSAFESYISCMTESESDFDLRPKPKSFIRPAVNQQNLKKTDPVTKYFQYKQFWEAFKVPGERDRRALRWEIRERLAHEPPPTKPRRVLVPNTYTVPTEKKRAALRWEIRSDLAHGLIPHKLSHGC